MVTDPAKIVADSIEAEQPIIVVSVNYRLNIFSFGDGKERNLALKDQRLGIDWVRKNIAAFGGNPVCVKSLQISLMVGPILSSQLLLGQHHSRW